LRGLLHSDRQEDMICFGHHHPIHYFNNLNRIFLNLGSLGCNDKPTARFAIAQMDGDELQVELKETRYDNTEFLASYSKLEVPDREFILKVFHGDQLR
jgi:predicted phosphodiesterase